MGLGEQRICGSGVNALETRGDCLLHSEDGVACGYGLLEC